jgi:hypothetical protein
MGLFKRGVSYEEGAAYGWRLAANQKPWIGFTNISATNHLVDEIFRIPLRELSHAVEGGRCLMVENGEYDTENVSVESLDTQL